MKASKNKLNAEHYQAFIARYPELCHVPLTHTWGGVYAISRNFTNFFGQLEDGVYASACDNGVGVAWGTISGTSTCRLCRWSFNFGAE